MSSSLESTLQSLSEVGFGSEPPSKKHTLGDPASINQGSDSSPPVTKDGTVVRGLAPQGAEWSSVHLGYIILMVCILVFGEYKDPAEPSKVSTRDSNPSPDRKFEPNLRFV